MKKMIFMVGAVLSLTLFSFDGTQKKRVVKLRNGNYQVKNLDTNLKDLISKLGEYKGWEGTMVLGNTVNEKELKGKIISLNQFQEVKGWKETAIVHKTGQTTAIHDQFYKDAISETIYRDKKIKMDNLRNTQIHIDKVMNEFN